MPVQNSEVYVLNNTTSTSQPPTPLSPCQPRAMSPISDDELDLNALPITPPSYIEPCPVKKKKMDAGLHVIRTQATALAYLAQLYETSPSVAESFVDAVDTIIKTIDTGKVVISGVGKSGIIAKKLVATMTSLSIHAAWLDPSNALHGDLGLIKKDDAILLITYSGKTPELLTLMNHFSPSNPLIVLTAHTHPSTCVINNIRPDAILLSAPIHELEKVSFGVSAPTTSTTAAITLGDALAIAISKTIHDNTHEIFLKNHPGGAIGATIKPAPKKISEIAIPLDSIAPVDKGRHSYSTGMHLMMASLQSTSGWARDECDSVASSLQIKKLKAEDMNNCASQIPGLLIPRESWIMVLPNMEVQQVALMIEEMRRSEPDGQSIYSDEAIIATNDKGMRVIDIATVLAMPS